MNAVTEHKPVGMSSFGTGAAIAPQTLNDVVEFSKIMSKGDIALPKHLRGNVGACLAVAMQALQWEMNPFAVASKSYSVSGSIAYEAQLIAAVVNTRSGIKGRLKYKFDGEGDKLTCTVTGELDGEICTYSSPPMGAITTKNSPLWKSDPEQQLGYFSARSWARRHCPEVLLGVYDRDEVENFQGPTNAKDVTPNAEKYLTKPKGETSDTLDGFNSNHVDSEIDALNSGGGAETSSAQGEGDAAPTADPSPDLDIETLRNVRDVLWAIFDHDNYQASDDPNKWAKSQSGVVFGRLQNSVLSSANQKTMEAANGVLEAFKAVCDGKDSQEAYDFFDEVWGV